MSEQEDGLREAIARAIRKAMIPGTMFGPDEDDYAAADAVLVLPEVAGLRAKAYPKATCDGPSALDMANARANRWEQRYAAAQTKVERAAVLVDEWHEQVQAVVHSDAPSVRHREVLRSAVQQLRAALASRPTTHESAEEA